MKTVFRIFAHDMRGIKKNLIIFAVVIGITILPALYAWFNIAANWDPYSNTGALPFAVASLDEGFTFHEYSVNAGESIVDNLKKNDQMKWTFVDADQATEGVKTGEYYAAVIIPKDFSANMMSLISGKFEQAKLEYYVNDKVNSVSPKIMDKGVEAIQQATDSSFVSQLTEALAKVLNTTDTELEGEKKTLLERIKKGLTESKTDIETLISSTDLMVSTLDSVEGMMKTVKQLEPTIRKTLSDAGVMVGDVGDALKSAKSTSKQLVPIINGILDSAFFDAKEISSKLDEILDAAGDDADLAVSKINDLESLIRKKISFNEELISIFTNINSDLGVDCSAIIKKLEHADKVSNEILDKLESAADKITKSGTVSDSIKSDLKEKIDSIDSDYNAVKKEFSSIKKDIDKKLNDSFTSMDGIAGFAQTISSGTDQMDTAYNNATTMNKNLKKVLADLKTFLQKINKKLDMIIKKIDNPGEIGAVIDFIRPIIDRPAALGEFISNPVELERNDVYPISNYGSSMTPFYSSLALWVGGIVMAAVLCVSFSEGDKKRFPMAGPTVQYFGRYLTIFVIGQIQALIIGLGDMFFLKSQIENPYLFIFACMISSFVYTLFIYSLTICFSVIGKALSVIILVLQIAGSGGTFPIEVLPAAFQAIAPYLPFRYGVNALRETVGGADVGSYWKYIGTLLLFLIPALLIGLLLRRPCMRVVAFFDRKIDESDLIL